MYAGGRLIFTKSKAKARHDDADLWICNDRQGFAFPCRYGIV